MVKAELRIKSVGTKLTDAEYGRLVAAGVRAEEEVAEARELPREPIT